MSLIIEGIILFITNKLEITVQNKYKGILRFTLTLLIILITIIAFLIAAYILTKLGIYVI